MHKKNENGTLAGVMYCYIHFVVEVISFFVMTRLTGDVWLAWFLGMMYDILAFVPQFFIGMASDKFGRIPFGVIGMVMLMFGMAMFEFVTVVPVVISVAVVALGNACVHVSGAEVTLRSGRGKMAPAAVFVAGGSFGVVTGKLLATTAPVAGLGLLGLSAIPVIIYAERFKKGVGECRGYRLVNEGIAPLLVVLGAFFVVMVRSYIGYGIPTSWNKTLAETVMLYCCMGVGKALGGVLIDKIGIRRVIWLSTVVAIPFLVFGNEIMAISLIGVMLFSMTMAICLGILVSEFPKRPGMAFGVTTIGLALGVLPVFFFRVQGVVANCVMIGVMSLLCLVILLKIAKKEKR